MLNEHYGLSVHLTGYLAHCREALRHGPKAVTQRGQPAVTVIATAEHEGLRRAAAASRPVFCAHLLMIPPTDDFLRARGSRAFDLS